MQYCNTDKNRHNFDAELNFLMYSFILSQNINFIDTIILL